MQTFEDKKRSTIEAMNYSANLGLTAHLDQVLFPTPGPLHPDQILSNLDQYRMYDSWLALHREGKAIVRLQMNFLQNQSDPELPELKERLRNQFQFFGWFPGMENKIGSIEPGKLADLAVLNKDYFALTDEEIKQIRSVLTLVDGKIVYNARVVA